jgi:flagellar basal body rod protein FlgG
MAGGAYSALSGLQTRLAQLDRIAADISNAGTAGYKTERVPTVEARRPDFGQVLQTAIDVAAAPGLIDFREGQIQTTGRDLDAGLDGKGFFEVQAPEGLRYTRNGQFSRRPDGTLVTADGDVVLGDDGKPITLGQGAVAYEPDGSIRAGGVLAGRIRVVDFGDYVSLRREGGRFRAEGNNAPIAAPATTRVLGGTLEASNVQLPERMVQLTEVSRAFEALQRGITTLMNDVDGRAISELGRR